MIVCTKLIFKFIFFIIIIFFLNFILFRKCFLFYFLHFLGFLSFLLIFPYFLLHFFLFFLSSLYSLFYSFHSMPKTLFKHHLFLSIMYRKKKCLLNVFFLYLQEYVYVHNNQMKIIVKLL